MEGHTRNHDHIPEISHTLASRRGHKLHLRFLANRAWSADPRRATRRLRFSRGSSGQGSKGRAAPYIVLPRRCNINTSPWDTSKALVILGQGSLGCAACLSIAAARGPRAPLRTVAGGVRVRLQAARDQRQCSAVTVYGFESGIAGTREGLAAI